MSEQPKPPRRTSSETGMMPKVDYDPDTIHESPQPPDLPELPGDAAGITGQVPLYSEGTDNAKQADDSATLDSNEQPRQRRARR